MGTLVIHRKQAFAGMAQEYLPAVEFHTQGFALGNVCHRGDALPAIIRHGSALPRHELIQRQMHAANPGLLVVTQGQTALAAGFEALLLQL
jgi:hypothetical protein